MPTKGTKARSAGDCERLEQLPNVGPRIAADLRLIGIHHPRDLAARDGFELYLALGRATGRRHDPCVLDTFLAATDFMRGAAPRPWWAYTPARKAQHPALLAQAAAAPCGRLRAAAGRHAAAAN